MIISDVNMLIDNYHFIKLFGSLICEYIQIL